MALRKSRGAQVMYSRICKALYVRTNMYLDDLYWLKFCRQMNFDYEESQIINNRSRFDSNINKLEAK